MNRLMEALLDLLFPPRCIFCTRLLAPQEQDLCTACRQNLPWLAGDAAEQPGEGFSLCVSPLQYRDSVRNSLHRYKFEGHRGYHRVYGKLMAQCVRSRLDGRYDLITWAPLSAKRRRERGYDQAYLLAESMAKALGMRPQPLLRKVRHTAAQSSLKEDASRKSNVQGAYTAINPALTAGKRILVVDDIVTTGSTLTACALALREAGAAEVLCVTAARARQSGTLQAVGTGLSGKTEQHLRQI